MVFPCRAIRLFQPCVCVCVCVCARACVCVCVYRSCRQTENLNAKWCTWKNDSAGKDAHHTRCHKKHEAFASAVSKARLIPTACCATRSLVYPCAGGGAAGESALRETGSVLTHRRSLMLGASRATPCAYPATSCAQPDQALAAQLPHPPRPAPPQPSTRALSLAGGSAG